MSFPRYPAYKDSGIKWLGEVPAHWEMRRLKLVCHAFPSNVDKKSYDGQDFVRLCNYVDVYYNDEISADLPFMEATASKEEIAKFTLFPGDTIITKDSEAADDIAIASYVPQELPGVVCGYHLTIVRPLSDMCGRFVKRLFDSHFLKAQFEVAANGLTRVGLSQYAIDNALLPVPPAPEQSAIAAFLDRETGKIDALVAEQEKLIGLLKEKRQAVISHAVTRGLDPSAPMKDSGIPWLGKVPAHWEVAPLGAVTQIIQTGPFGSQLHAADYLADHVPVINPANLQEEGISPNWSNTVLSDVRDRLSEYVLKYKDIILGRRGEMGRCAVVEEREVGWLCGTGSLIIRLSEQVLPHFLSTFIRTLFVREWLALQSVGSTMDNLNAGILSRLKVPVPPQEEQILILSQLERQTAKFDTLIAEAQRAIELLKEHRSALISAAVTGKIDVRNCVALQEVA